MFKSQGSWHVLVIPALERRSQAAPEGSLSRPAVAICVSARPMRDLV